MLSWASPGDAAASGAHGCLGMTMKRGKNKFDTKSQTGCLAMPILQEVLAAALLWILDEALLGAPLGLPVPFGQETGILFLAQLRAGSR